MSTSAFQALGELNDKFGTSSNARLTKIIAGVRWMTDAEWNFTLAWYASKNLPRPGRTMHPPPSSGPSVPPSGSSADEAKIINVQVRTEFVNKQSIFDFLAYTAARRIFTPGKGSIAAHLRVILQRGRPVRGQ